MIAGASLALAALLFAASPFGGLHWRSIGPAIGGGRTTSVAGSDRDPLLYYFGAMDGGVWKTTDAGATWTDVWSHQPVAAIGAVTIAPSDDAVVWVGTGESNSRNDTSYGDGVWVSRDGGRSWMHRGLDATFAISRILVSPRDPDVALVGATGDFYRDTPDRGVFRTTDGGRSWKKTLYVGPQSGISDLAADPSGRVVFAGVWQFHRVPWDFASGGPLDGLYRSRDAGATWQRLSGHGLPDGYMGRIGVAVSRSDPRVVYAVIQSRAGVLWRSDDGGDHWRRVNADTYVNQRPFYMSHVAVDPTNPDHVMSMSEDLVESRDGGRTFVDVSGAVHQDHHGMWWSADGKRLIEADDGGAPISMDGGATWLWRFNVPIGQVYHVGYDDENPYHVCGGLQDNDSFCGPSDSLNPLGILDSDWRDVGDDGDGSWVWPDPSDPSLIWNVGVSTLNGQLGIYDMATRENRDVTPAIEDTNGNAIAGETHRYNWQAPIAFSGTAALYGSNVLFLSTDRGLLWKTVSPDLTRDEKQHQQTAGGPINTDVSGAEFFDTIVDIGVSPVDRRVVWVGTDDGLVQVTRDVFAPSPVWQNVSVRGIGPYGRVECVEPSAISAAGAFAVVDRHMMGDRHPYVFSTDDFGAHWRPIVAGLPSDQYAHVVRQSRANPDLLFAGLEQGVWVSFDRGRKWQTLKLDMPPASVADLRIQPTYDELIAGTHGRSFFILDDLRPLEGFAAAQNAGAPTLFAPRPAYLFWRWWSVGFGAGGRTGGGPECCEPADRFAGTNPDGGALISYALPAGSRAQPNLQVLDSAGRVVRTLDASADPGINRVSWDLRESPPPIWMSAREWNQGADGARVVPGKYVVRLRMGAFTQRRALVVNGDPRAKWTQADYQARHDFERGLLDELGQIDVALNALDARARRRPLTSAERSAYDALTSNPRNSEDDLLKPDRLRERLQTLLLDISLSAEPPTPGQRAEASAIAAAYDRAIQTFRAAIQP